MLDAELYARIRSRLSELGYGRDYEWSQSVGAPETSVDLAREYTWVVLNSGMRHTVAEAIMGRVWPLLLRGQRLGDAFRHRGKAAALEDFWRRKSDRLAELAAARNVVAWCETLPWIGPITKFHLAKNLGVDVAKPDRWLERLAAAGGESVDDLCDRLARSSGDRVATVDVVLWRACAVHLLAVEGGAVRYSEVARGA